MSNAFVLIQGDRIILTHNGQTVTVDRSSTSSFDDVVEAINAKDYDRAIELANPARAIETFYADDDSGTLEIRNNSVLFNGTRLAPALEDRLIEMHRHRLPLGPLTNFLARVQANPSATSRRELYLFLEGNRLPLTADGCFMAYKSVLRWSSDMTVNDEPLTQDDSGRPFADGDYRSIATSNENGLPTRLRIGDRLEMDRGNVDDRRENTCSFGYHFASLGYASSWYHGHDAILLMKIDPADVVSIPHDYGNQKGRTCAYEVAGVHFERTEENHKDEVEDTLSESPVYDGVDYESMTDGIYDMSNSQGRYELRMDTDDHVLSTHATRSEALTKMRENNSRNWASCHVYDTVADRRWRT